MSSTDQSRYDVIIFGGGPAGTLVASFLRREHPARRLLLLERGAHPRHHVGESSVPSWGPLLARAGVLEKCEAAGFISKVGALFQWGVDEREEWTIDFRDPETRGARRGSMQVDRAKFDQILFEHARALGTEAHERADVLAIDAAEGGGWRVTWRSADGVRVDQADHLVDASGQARLLARTFELEVAPFDGMNNFAIYGYWRGSKVAQLGEPLERPLDRWQFIATCHDGWLWHIPIERDLVSVGLVTDKESISDGGAAALEALYRRNIASSERVARLLQDGELTQHPLAPARLNVARDWSYRVATMCGPGWFLVGDAAAFVDPILSSGLLLTANGAAMAANALATLWSTADVDTALLQKSYQEQYTDMVQSYHRLASIWYSRSFKYDSWHWEAKRQRLRVGSRDPSEESAAAAFLQLCVGSFANPMEGAFFDPERGLLADVHREDARIYAAHLFKLEPGTSLHRELQASVAGGDEAESRAGVREQSVQRWRWLLGRPLALRRCLTQESERYFTAGTMGEWTRVRFLDVRDADSKDSFDRVVFPISAELPGGIMAHLDGERPLREVVRAALAHLPLGSRARGDVLELVYHQILQLQLRGLVDAGARQPIDATPPSWPVAFCRALASAGHGAWTAEVDLVGDTLSLRPDGAEEGGLPQIVMARSSRVPARWRYAATAEVALAYRGRELGERGRVFIADLAAALRGWESTSASEVAAFWDEILPALAGHRGAFVAHS